MDKRLFIGFKISRKIIDIINMLRSTLPDGNRYYNWASGNNLHLTLLFLGSQPENQIENICNRVEKNISQFNDFHIEISGTGAFSKNQQEQVLWLGVNEEDSILNRVNYELKSDLEDLIDTKRVSKFLPHITIARKKKKYINNKIDVKSFMNSVYFPMEFHVKYFTLFQSIPTEKGVRYVKIKNFPLL
tara:strand:- start:1453 stop:2016 length:564 start_codon:yes stop_codon:yes gene_type:complete